MVDAYNRINKAQIKRKLRSLNKAKVREKAIPSSQLGKGKSLFPCGNVYFQFRNKSVGLQTYSLLLQEIKLWNSRLFLCGM